MSILGLITVVIVLFVLIWAVQRLGKIFEVPGQITGVIVVLIVVLVVLWLVQALGGFAGGPVLRLR